MSNKPEGAPNPVVGCVGVLFVLLIIHFLFMGSGYVLSHYGEAQSSMFWWAITEMSRAFPLRDWFGTFLVIIMAAVAVLLVGALAAYDAWLRSW